MNYFLSGWMVQWWKIQRTKIEVFYVNEIESNDGLLKKR